MENVFTRSWTLTKLSFGVIRQDKELLLFPFLSTFFSLAVLVAFWIPLQTLWDQHSAAAHNSALQWGLLFVLYFILNFFATFFSVCAVHIIKKRLEGESEGLSASFAFAFSRIHLIAAWSLVAATVSVILRMLESLAGEKKSTNPLGIVVGILVSILVAGLKISWSIVTLFVVPAMVYKDMGPLDAIKESTNAIKKTWGESLVRSYGLGLIQFLVMMVGVLLLFGIGMGIASASEQPMAYIVMGGFIVAYLCIVFAVFSMANTIFNTALYAYAATGEIPKGYSKDVLENAFKTKA